MHYTTEATPGGRTRDLRSTNGGRWQDLDLTAQSGLVTPPLSRLVLYILLYIQLYTHMPEEDAAGFCFGNNLHSILMRDLSSSYMCRGNLALCPWLCP